MSIDKRIPRSAEEEAAGVFQVEDMDEARARAFTEKPFRDTVKGRIDSDREVLEKVADEQGDKAGQEYRELKALQPREILARLEEEFEGNLGGPKFDKDRDLLKQLPEKFSRYLEHIKREKAALQLQNRFEGLRPILQEGFNIVTPYGDDYYPSQEAENFLYQTLGVGQTRSEVVERFSKLSKEQREGVIRLTGVHGNADEVGYRFALPTKVDGINLFLMADLRERKKGPQILLKFTPEFIERAM